MVRWAAIVEWSAWPWLGTLPSSTFAYHPPKVRCQSGQIPLHAPRWCAPHTSSTTAQWNMQLLPTSFCQNIPARGRIDIHVGCVSRNPG